MRMTIPADPVCERARCLASLRVDGETTEFEEAFLDSHLDACGDCREHAIGLEASTALIRATPLVAPVVHPIALRHRSTHRLRHVQVAAAALVVLGAGFTGMAGIPHPNGSSIAPSKPRPAYLDSASYEQKVIRQIETEAPPALRRLNRLAS